MAPGASAPAVTPEVVRQAIAASLRTTSCSLLLLDKQPESMSTLRGVIGSDPAEQNLRATLQTVAPDVALDWQVARVGQVYCGLLDTVRPYSQPIDAGGDAVGITLADGRIDLAADDLIIPRVTMPDFGGSLQIDYISNNGEVLHLHQALAGLPYAARSTLTFGEPRLPKFGGWAVDQPFGTDLVVVIASSAPLFPAPRPAEEKLDGYLRNLAATLDTATHGGARVSAAVLLLRTRPKD
jgi:serine/threonine-protein kinase